MSVHRCRSAVRAVTLADGGYGHGLALLLLLYGRTTSAQEKEEDGSTHGKTVPQTPGERVQVLYNLELDSSFRTSETPETYRESTGGQHRHQGYQSVGGQGRGQGYPLTTSGASQQTGQDVDEEAVK